MRPLRYSINVTLDGCCDHRALSPDQAMHRHHTENLARADALLFGRVTYHMMEEACGRRSLRRGWLAGHGPTLFAGLSQPLDLRLEDRIELTSGAVAMRYVPRRSSSAPSSAG